MDSDLPLVKRSRIGSTLPEIHAEDIPALRTMMSTVRRNPMPALKDLLTGKPPKNVLLTVVNLCLLEPRVRRLGSAKVFIQYIVDGYEDDAHADVGADVTSGVVAPPESEPEHELSQTPEPTSQEEKEEPVLEYPPGLTSAPKPRPWETPLRGIVNILAGIKGEKSPSRLDVKTIDELRAAYKPIMDAIWRDSGYILLPGPGGDFRRSLIARAICLFANLDGMKQNMYDETSLSLVMHCWLYMSSHFKYRQCALYAVQALFQNPRNASAETKELAVQTVTVDVLRERFVDILKQDTLVDQALEEELWTFFQFAITPLSLTFAKAEVYNDISSALQQQLHHGSEQWAYDIFNISHQIIYYMLEITPDSEKMSRFTHMIDSSLLEVAAAGLVIAERRGTEDWLAFLNRLMHTLNCTDTDCPFTITPEFRAATHASFEPLYLPFRIVLQGLDSKGGSRGLMLWEELATLLDVSEEKIKEKWREKRQCGNAYCPNRIADVKTLVCLRCHTIYYCDKACQKRDWKHHKPQCKKEVLPVTIEATIEDEAVPQ